jgi:excisionase family DNA binding protein
MTTTATLPGAVEPVLLLDVRAVARMLNCSWRHVYRMADSGRMPPPVRIGASVRWRRADLVEWVSQGCPAIRRGARTS